MDIHRNSAPDSQEIMLQLSQVIYMQLKRSEWLYDSWRPIRRTLFSFRHGHDGILVIALIVAMACGHHS